MLGAALLFSGCGGGGSAPPATTAAAASAATSAELAWARRVDGFAAGLVPDLKRLERLTGGGPKIGAAGRRLDPGIFVPGPKRRRFESAMTALATCTAALDGAVPPAPSERLRPVRQTFVHACTQLELVPVLLRADVLRARSAKEVSRDTVAEAAGRANEGVRSIVDGLSTVRRLLGTS